MGNNTISFRSTQSLKQIARVLCPTKNGQGKLIARAEHLDVENITRKIATFLPLSRDEIKRDKDTWQDQALKDFNAR